MTNTYEAEDAEEDVWGVCLQRVAQRDQQAFARLFDHFAPRIKAFALSSASGQHGQFAEELVQEVMTTIWYKAGSYDSDKASVSTWIFTIARNKRIDLLRKNQRHGGALDIEEVWGLEDDGAGPLGILQQRSGERRVREALNELPPAQREILFLAYMEGLSHSEIAEQLALPLGTVKSRARLALQRLQSMLDRREFD